MLTLATVVDRLSKLDLFTRPLRESKIEKTNTGNKHVSL